MYSYFNISTQYNLICSSFLNIVRELTSATENRVFWKSNFLDQNNSSPFFEQSLQEYRAQLYRIFDKYNILLNPSFAWESGFCARITHINFSIANFWGIVGVTKDQNPQEITSEVKNMFRMVGLIKVIISYIENNTYTRS